MIISDISAGGCFVYVDFNIDPGTELSILIVCDTYHINLNAKVMRIIRESDRYMGYGLMFTRINEAGKQGLTGLMEKIKNISRSDIEDSDSLSENKRHFTRFFIGYHISIEIGQNHNPATLVDISKSGCCVQTEADYETNLSCFFSFSVKHSHFKIDSRIIWRRGESGNRIYGIQFMKRDRATISPLKELISHASKLGASKKELNKDRYFDSCDKKLENTPYVLIKFIKKILKIKNGK
ncbi:MAG: PilZ domain-containing protein [Deltaproteobacteria bacterium]|nr:PilZ domain-containing protein [Deltaproteobacteria bacterium]